MGGQDIGSEEKPIVVRFTEMDGVIRFVFALLCDLRGRSHEPMMIRLSVEATIFVEKKQDKNVNKASRARDHGQLASRFIRINDKSLVFCGVRYVCVDFRSGAGARGGSSFPVSKTCVLVLALFFLIVGSGMLYLFHVCFYLSVYLSVSLCLSVYLYVCVSVCHRLVCSREGTPERIGARVAFIGDHPRMLALLPRFMLSIRQLWVGVSFLSVFFRLRDGGGVMK